MSGEPSVVQQFRDHRIVFTPGTVVKEPTAPSYASRLDDERAFYRFAMEHGFSNFPRVVRWDPFELERVSGVPLHHLTDLSDADRQAVFGEVIATVARLHALDDRAVQTDDLRRMYVLGPADSAEAIDRALGSGWPRPRSVNGRPVAHLDFLGVQARVRSLGEQVRPPLRFVPIHGDLSLSNILWDRPRRRVVLLSPRGRFGASPIYGDALLDWARLFFAVKENSDALVEGAFRIDRDANDARVQTGSGGWETFTGPLRATASPRWDDLLRLQPLLALTVAATVLRRPTQLEAAYLRALELLAERDG